MLRIRGDFQSSLAEEAEQREKKEENTPELLSTQKSVHFQQGLKFPSKLSVVHIESVKYTEVVVTF